MASVQTSFDVHLPQLMVARNTVYLQCFLDSTEQKHWYLRRFRHVARSDFLMQKSQNPCKLQYFGSVFRVCDGVEGGLGGGI